LHYTASFLNHLMFTVYLEIYLYEIYGIRTHRIRIYKKNIQENTSRYSLDRD